MHRRAIAHLKRADPVMARVIDQVGPCRLRPHNEGSHFEHLARAIVYQQLSGKAAATIFGRVRELAGGATLDPERLIALPEPTLRAAGLSKQKLGYLRDLAHRTVTRSLAIETLHEMSDDDVMSQLIQIKGVGKWTVQMFLMFRLGRPDVLPVGDLGIQKGVKLAYGLRKHPSPERVEKIGACWAPYRTVASWYLYRLLEVEWQARPRARPR